MPQEVDGSPVCPRCRSRIGPLPAPRCDRCSLPAGTRRMGGVPCAHCAGWPDVLEGALCVTAFVPPAQALLHALKYDGWASIVPFMARRMAALLGTRSVLRQAAAVVPVPTTARRRRSRGYNQSALLAREVARRVGIPFADPLVRRDADASQTVLLAEERAANVEHAFFSGGPSSLPGSPHHLILVDDVLTTGATASAAARALAGLGARSVTVLAFARTLPRAVDGVSAAS